VFSEVKFPLRYWRNRSEEVIDFIKNCLIKDPNKRMNINVLLEHPWFKKFIKDNDAEK
jgi:serine/threonine protein kinase